MDKKTIELIKIGLAECHNAKERHGMLIAYSAEFGRETVRQAAQEIGREYEFTQAMKDKDKSLRK